MKKGRKESSKKARKPYTITKPRESWTKEEHQRFVEALELYERDWKKIGAYVESKTVIQIRSHAQKYFIKMQKIGKTECIPPPRPKRRSKSPYPKSKDSPSKPRKGARLHGGGSEGNDTGDPSWLPADPNDPAYVANAVTPAMQWQLVEKQQLQELQQEQLSQAQYYLQQAMAADVKQKALHGGVLGEEDDDDSLDGDDFSSVPQSPRSDSDAYSDNDDDDERPHSKRKIKEEQPEFSKVYAFLGSLFDPSTSGHMEELNKMSDIDREIVQVLMHNLASNLSSQSQALSPYSGTDEPVPDEPPALDGDTQAVTSIAAPLPHSPTGPILSNPLSALASASSQPFAPNFALPAASSREEYASNSSVPSSQVVNGPQQPELSSQGPLVPVSLTPSKSASLLRASTVPLNSLSTAPPAMTTTSASAPEFVSPPFASSVLSAINSLDDTSPRLGSGPLDTVMTECNAVPSAPVAPFGVSPSPVLPPTAAAPAPMQAVQTMQQPPAVSMDTSSASSSATPYGLPPSSVILPQAQAS